MQQVELYLKGERDYGYIKGDTGPLVYPGLHVYIYRWLYAFTGQGEDIFRGQLIFALLYLMTLATVMACYQTAKVGTERPLSWPISLLTDPGTSVHLSSLDSVQEAA